MLQCTPFDVVKGLRRGLIAASDLSVHCAARSSVCTAANGAVTDLLPDEPGGYSNFAALFGGKYLNTAFGPLKDLDGNVVSDSKGKPGDSGLQSDRHRENPSHRISLDTISHVTGH